MFSDLFGQMLRDTMGMPTKATSFDIRLEPFRNIIECIKNIEKETIKYFEESYDIDWTNCLADEQKMKYQMLNGNISAQTYTDYCFLSEEKKRSIIGNYVDNNNSQIIMAMKNKLLRIWQRGKNDKIISLMCFDTWNDMLDSLELAEKYMNIFESSDEYTRAKQIAEIRERYLRDRHMRRGR